jgi:hypothetical protein
LTGRNVDFWIIGLLDASLFPVEPLALTFLTEDGLEIFCSSVYILCVVGILEGAGISEIRQLLGKAL